MNHALDNQANDKEAIDDASGSALGRAEEAGGLTDYHAGAFHG